MFKKVIKKEWKFPADIDHLGQMRDAVTRFGRKYGVSEREINAFKLAIDEAGTNIIRHAYRDWEGDITIRMIVREKTVTVSLIDQGHSFDMRHVQDPDLQRYVDIGKKGGLGIFIIRRVIDDIDYRKTESGNELRMTKHRQFNPVKKLAIPEVSFSMKTRFSLIASAIFTSVVLIVGAIQYFQQSGKVMKRYLEPGKSVAGTVARRSLQDLTEGNTVQLYELAREFYDENQSYVSEILILDSAQTIQGAAVLGGESAFRFFRMPMQIKKISKNVSVRRTSTQYYVADETLYYEFGKNIKPVLVYDISIPVINTVPDIPVQLGTVHLYIKKSLIDKEIRIAKSKTITYGLITLLSGCLGIFILVYITMAPFKRLSRWIRDLGHGEVQDEMEFNAEDEIGEIAQAFNDITSKFRKSQENLAEQERLQKEMQVAQEIQHTLLPAAFPKVEGYEIASYYEAAKEVGGDYFDFVEVDRDTLGVVVADVSGKGVPGSLVMTMIRTALRTEARGNKNAADVLARVNDFVINDMKRGMFVTIFYLILDSKKRTINYASAGHNPMILLRGQTQKSYYLNPRGFPIGINLPDKELFRNSIESDNIHLREDDVLILYTDGITEAMDLNREHFGDERLLSVLRRNSGLKVEPLVEKIQQSINDFTGGHPQSDDITLVAIREKMSVDEVMFNMRNRLLSLVKVEKKSIKEACKIVGVSTSTYYKYKKRFEAYGEEGLRETVHRSDIEEKHIAIEDKAKIFDIIINNPGLGPKRIMEELNTEKYGHMDIDETRIYDELVRSRLNTKELRQAFVEKGDHGKRMKPPGTPLLTLDGKVIISEPRPRPNYRVQPSEPKETETVEEETPPPSPAPAQGSVIPPEKSKEEEATTLFDDVLKFDTDEDEENILDIHEISPQTPDPELTEDDEMLLLPDEAEQGSDIFNFLDVDTEPDQKKTPKPEDPEEEVLEVEMFDDVMDAVTDTFQIMDQDMMDEKRDESRGEKPSMDEILESEIFIPELDAWSPIEEDIAGFSAGSLLDEALEPGSKEELMSKFDPDGEDGPFAEMLEELGFEPETAEAGSAAARRNVQQDVYRINAKRYEESGKWFYREGFYAKAIEEFQKVLRIDTENAGIYQCLGDTYFRLGQLDKAKNAYESVRRLDPENINVLENLGVVFANQGEYKKAVWQWGEVLKLAPGRKDIVERIKRMQRVIRQRSV